MLLQCIILQQHGKQCRCKEQFAVPGGRPDETPALQTFCQQPLPVAGGPEQLHLAAPASPEDEDIAGHRVILQDSLDFSGKAVEAVSHIGDTCHYPDSGSGRPVNHNFPPLIIFCSKRSSISADGLCRLISPCINRVWRTVRDSGKRWFNGRQFHGQKRGRCGFAVFTPGAGDSALALSEAHPFKQLIVIDAIFALKRIHAATFIAGFECLLTS